MNSQKDRERKCRPFPWDCPDCGKRTVVPAEISYTAESKYDGTVHSVHLPALKVPQCESCGALVFTDSADEQINAALRKELALLSPHEIRAARKELSLSQASLAQALGVAVETISRWETGALIQSRAMDNFLRLYFELPEVRAALNPARQNVGFSAGSAKNEERRGQDQTTPWFARFPCAIAAYGRDEIFELQGRICNQRRILQIGRG